MEENTENIKFILTKTLSQINRCYTDHLLNINKFSDAVKENNFELMDKHEKKCAALLKKIDKLYAILDNVTEHMPNDNTLFKNVIVLSKQLNIESKITDLVHKIDRLIHSILDLNVVTEHILSSSMNSIQQHIADIQKGKHAAQRYTLINNADPRFLDKRS